MMSRSIIYEEVEKRIEDRHKLVEACSRARIEGSDKNSCDDNTSNLERLGELLDEAFRAYVDIVPYLKNVTPYLTNTVLKQIKNIEQLMELEIENGLSKNKNIDIDIDSIMKESRESFL